MKIGVIGTGTMGNGIAQTFAQGGYPVVMKDLSDELLQKAVENIDNSLSRLVAKEKLNEADKQQILARIATTLSYEDFNDCGLIVEAIAENIELKKKVFRELDETCPPGTILATNSSSLSITEIAACTRRPEKVIGMHFFNPVPVLKLVEVIRGQLTADCVFDSVSGIAGTGRFNRVGCLSGYPGGVTPRVWRRQISPASAVAQNGPRQPTGKKNRNRFLRLPKIKGVFMKREEDKVPALPVSLAL